MESYPASGDRAEVERPGVVTVVSQERCPLHRMASVSRHMGFAFNERGHSSFKGLGPLLKALSLRLPLAHVVTEDRAVSW